MATDLECSLLMSKQKLDLTDILREAAAIPTKSIKFVLFSLLTSFPLLCFLIFHDIVLHKTLANTSNVVSYDPDSSYYYISYDAETWSQRVSTNRTYTTLKDLCPQLIQSCLLYLVPYQFIELFTLVMTVDASSHIYTKDNNNRVVSLKEMILKPFGRTRLVGTLITSLYDTLFSTATLIGLLWIVINYYILSGGYSSYFSTFRYFHDEGGSVIKIILIVVHGAAFWGLLRKYLEWSAGWNMSLVVSVVEEVYGGEALDVSDYFIRGSEDRGLLLMLVFFAWVVVLRLPCLYLGCGVLVTSVFISLACLGNVMKWVSLMVYFYDCKRRVLEKKIDVEVGREAKAVVGS